MVYFTYRLHGGTDSEKGGSSWGASMRSSEEEARRKGRGGGFSPLVLFSARFFFALHPTAFFLELWNILSKEDSSKHADVKKDITALSDEGCSGCYLCNSEHPYCFYLLTIVF